MQTITLELPDSLYHSVTQIARVTKRPLAEILQESLSHTLPPLDDVDSDEADILAQLSALDDAALWHEFQSGIVEKEQDLLDTLLDGQNAGNLTSEDQQTLAYLLDQYGRLLSANLMPCCYWHDVDIVCLFKRQQPLPPH